MSTHGLVREAPSHLHILVLGRTRVTVSKLLISVESHYQDSGAETDIFIWGGHWRGQFCNKGSCQWSV